VAEEKDLPRGGTPTLTSTLPPEAVALDRKGNLWIDLLEEVTGGTKSGLL